MTTATLTTEDLFALPDDGIEREIIRGELREYPVKDNLRESPGTIRTRRHSRALVSVANILSNWSIAEKTGGETAVGEAGIRLREEPETTVGADAAYFSAESIARMSADQPWYEGPPVLAVEILSTSDTHEAVVEKIHLYLECGVSVVWILDPDFQTVTIHRANCAPQMLRAHETLEGDPELPRLSVPVREFFN